jgi:Lon protease-like protein
MRSPMFPLGSVLFPTAVLPLRIFEPRYQAMLAAVLAADDPVFGVVLIERGSEVGGGDVRTRVGTFARVVRAEAGPGGMWGVIAVGERRFRVTEWLPDDPYPQADVEELPDHEPAEAIDGLYDDVRGLLRRVLALCSEMGVPATPATVELHPSTLLGSYQAAAASPFGPADRQRLLEVGGPHERLLLLHQLLLEERGFLEARLALDGATFDVSDDDLGPDGTDTAEGDG